MWRKLLWAYLVIYILGVVLLIIYDAVVDLGNQDFQPISLLLPIFLLVPAGVLVSALRQKKVPLFLIIVSLLIVAIPLAGIFGFNDLSFATLGKALFFVPLLAGLIYFGYLWLVHKR